jgi:hypothetical protein
MAEFKFLFSWGLACSVIDRQTAAGLVATDVQLEAFAFVADGSCLIVGCDCFELLP